MRQVYRCQTGVLVFLLAWLGFTLTTIAYAKPSKETNQAQAKDPPSIFRCSQGPCMVKVDRKGKPKSFDSGSYSALDIAHGLIGNSGKTLPNFKLGKGWQPTGWGMFRLSGCAKTTRGTSVEVSRENSVVKLDFSIHSESDWKKCFGSNKIVWALKENHEGEPGQLMFQRCKLSDTATSGYVPGKNYSVYVGVSGTQAMLSNESDAKNSLSKDSQAANKCSPNEYMLLVGQLKIPTGQTDLQRRFSERPKPTEPWFAGNWKSGEFSLSANKAFPSAELAVATSANVLKLVEAHPSGKVNAWSLVASDDPTQFRLPDELVQNFAQEQWGAAANYVTLGREDWMRLFQRLSICIAASYKLQPRVPKLANRCQPLTAVISLGFPSSVSVVLQSSMRVLSPQGKPMSIAQDPTELQGAVVAATVGDKLQINGTVRLDGAVLQACTQNNCTPIADGTELTRPGLFELRWAPQSDSRYHRQGISIQKILVLEPLQSWRPTGIQTTSWRRASAVSSHAFEFVRGESRTTGRVELGKAASALARRERIGGVETELSPIGLNAAKRDTRSGFVLLVDRKGRCPTIRTYSADTQLLPETLLVDQGFYVFLAFREKEGRIVRCLARTRFQVREQRAKQIGAITYSVLGDPMLTYESADTNRMAVVVPMVSASIPLGKHLVAATSGGVFASQDFDQDGDVGTRVWSSISVGNEKLPRLLTLGVGLDTGFSSGLDTVIFIGINLGTAYDSVGGR